jgi:hypothetical protein
MLCFLPAEPRTATLRGKQRRLFKQTLAPASARAFKIEPAYSTTT